MRLNRLFALSATLSIVSAEALPASTSMPGVRLVEISDDLELPIALAPIEGPGKGVAIAQIDGEIRFASGDSLARRSIVTLDQTTGDAQTRGFVSLLFPKGGAELKELFVYFADQNNDSLIGRLEESEPRRADEDQLKIEIKVIHTGSVLGRGALVETAPGTILVAISSDSESSKRSNSFAGRLLNLKTKEVVLSDLRCPNGMWYDPQTKRLFLIESCSPKEQAKIVFFAEGSSTAQTIYQQALGGISGGLIYRGEKIPALKGECLFSNTGSKTLSALREDLDGTWKVHDIATVESEITAISSDGDGEVVFVTKGGYLYRLEST